ncbi:MAG: hypothetical protein ACLRT4_13605 [Thomasclavelia sp.]|mgnify:FL=1
MYKIITIEDKQIPMMSNGATLREYRRFFQRDLISDFMKVQKAVKLKKYDDFEITAMVENITWTLAHKADPNIDDIDKWLEQFDSPFAILKKFNEIAELLDKSMKTTVKPKNSKSQKRQMKK